MDCDYKIADIDLVKGFKNTKASEENIPESKNQDIYCKISLRSDSPLAHRGTIELDSKLMCVCACVCVSSRLCLCQSNM